MLHRVWDHWQISTDRQLAQGHQYRQYYLTLLTPAPRMVIQCNKHTAGRISIEHDSSLKKLYSEGSGLLGDPPLTATWLDFHGFTAKPEYLSNCAPKIEISAPAAIRSRTANTVSFEFSTVESRKNQRTVNQAPIAGDIFPPQNGNERR